MLFNYIYYFCLKFSEKKVLFYIIIFIISIVLRISTESPLLFDGDYPESCQNNSNYINTNQGYRVESDNRSIYEMGNRSTPRLPVQERQYRPYNPNNVITSEGYRVELENNEINPNRINRISNPSHYLPFGPFNQVPNSSSYPTVNPETSTLFGTVHSGYGSNNIGLIEPTPSEIRASGYYSGNDPTYGANYEEKSNIISSIKKGVRKSLDKAERFVEERDARVQEKARMLTQKYPDHYINGKGPLSRAELAARSSRNRRF